MQITIELFERSSACLVVFFLTANPHFKTTIMLVITMGGRYLNFWSLSFEVIICIVRCQLQFGLQRSLNRSERLNPFAKQNKLKYPRF